MVLPLLKIGNTEREAIWDCFIIITLLLLSIIMIIIELNYVPETEFCFTYALFMTQI